MGVLFSEDTENSCDQRPQEYLAFRYFLEELCKKDLHDSDNHDGVITNLEPDILDHYEQS